MVKVFLWDLLAYYLSFLVAEINTQHSFQLSIHEFISINSCWNKIQGKNLLKYYNSPQVWQ
jgi:hypothetical protein